MLERANMSDARHAYECARCSARNLTYVLAARHFHSGDLPALTDARTLDLLRLAMSPAPHVSGVPLTPTERHFLENLSAFVRYHRTECTRSIACDADWNAWLATLP